MTMRHLIMGFLNRNFVSHVEMTTNRLPRRPEVSGLPRNDKRIKL